MAHCDKEKVHSMFIVSAARAQYSTSFFVDMRCTIMKAKVGIVEPVEVVKARQRHDKHVSAASGTDATKRNAIFSVRSFVAKAL
jgi:hypothetical protein